MRLVDGFADDLGPDQAAFQHANTVRDELKVWGLFSGKQRLSRDKD